MNIQTFLNSNKVPFHTLNHSATFDAQHLAQAVHMHGDAVAKAVLIRADGDSRYCVALLPAPARIDFTRLREFLGGSEVGLASENEIAELCGDCESGVVPPFGSQYGLSTLVDESLTHRGELVFQGNTHSEAVEMSYDDFARLERPLVAAFADHDRTAA